MWGRERGKGGCGGYYRVICLGREHLVWCVGFAREDLVVAGLIASRTTSAGRFCLITLIANILSNRV